MREAYLISKKLKLKDFEMWVNNELNGYSDVNNIPEYRKVTQVLKFFDPYHGWKDAVVSGKLSEIIGNASILQPISEIEYIISQDSDNLSMSIPSDFSKQLQNLYKTTCQPMFDINKTKIYGITEQVRNVLLKWTLKLEEDNILGNDDLIFSEQEKEAAKSIHIENFNGVMGNVDKVGTLSTGTNATNVYNENDINSEIDSLISEIKKLDLNNQEQVVVDLEDSKTNKEKAKTVLGGLLSRGAEVASVSSTIIALLGAL